MRDVAILTVGGAVFGLAIGLWLPAPGEYGWLLSTFAGAAAYGLFGLFSVGLSRLHGRPIGWALGGPIGLTLGAAVWMAVLRPVGDERALAIVGGFAGFFIGSICGSLLGAIALYRDIKSGRCTEQAEIIGTTAILLGAVIVGSVVATLTLIDLFIIRM